MSDKVIQIVTESSRVTILTEQGKLFHGHRRDHDQAGQRNISWEEMALPPGCDSHIQTDHTTLLQEVAGMISNAPPGGVLNIKETAALWDLVKDFGSE